MKSKMSLKRTLAIVTALCMVMSMCSFVVVFADDGDQAAPAPTTEQRLTDLASGAEAAADKAKEALDSVNDALSDATSALEQTKELADIAEGAIADVVDGIDAEAITSGVDKDGNIDQGQIDAVDAAVDELVSNVKDAAQAAQDAIDKAQEVVDSANAATAAAKDAEDAANDALAKAKEAEDIYGQLLQEAYDKSPKALQELAEAENAMREAWNEYYDAQKEADEAMADVIAAYDSLEELKADADKAYENAKDLQAEANRLLGIWKDLEQAMKTELAKTGDAELAKLEDLRAKARDAALEAAEYARDAMEAANEIYLMAKEAIGVIDDKDLGGQVDNMVGTANDAIAQVNDIMTAAIKEAIAIENPLFAPKIKLTAHVADGFNQYKGAGEILHINGLDVPQGGKAFIYAFDANGKWKDYPLFRNGGNSGSNVFTTAAQGNGEGYFYLPVDGTTVTKEKSKDFDLLVRIEDKDGNAAFYWIPINQSPNGDYWPVGSNGNNNVIFKGQDPVFERSLLKEGLNIDLGLSEVEFEFILNLYDLGMIETKEIKDDPTPPTPRPGHKTPGGTSSSVSINDNETPLAAPEEDIVIPEEDVPLANIPQTGIETGSFSLAMLGFSLMALLAMPFVKRREDSKA